jgi:hypothetical protein
LKVSFFGIPIDAIFSPGAWDTLCLDFIGRASRFPQPSQTPGGNRAVTLQRVQFILQ